MSATAIPMSEADLQAAIVECAKYLGYLVYHTYDSRRSEPGYPDLHCLRGRRSIFVELKAEGKYPTVAQAAWLDALQDAGHETHIWRPRNWTSGEVEAVLAGGEA